MPRPESDGQPGEMGGRRTPVTRSRVRALLTGDDPRYGDHPARPATRIASRTLAA